MALTDDNDSNVPLLQGDAGERLKRDIDRIENLLDEKKGIGNDVNEIYKDLKNSGFDTKVIKQIIKERAMSTAERRDLMAVMEVYKSAIGMVD